MATSDANLANCVSMVCRTWAVKRYTDRLLVERALDEELSYEALCQKNVRITGCVCQLMITLALLLTLDTAASPPCGLSWAVRNDCKAECSPPL